MELAALEHLKSPYRYTIAVRKAIVALWATYCKSMECNDSEDFGLTATLNKDHRPLFKKQNKKILWCCHISPDSVNGRRTDRKNTKNVYPVMKVVSVAVRVVAEGVRSA